MHINKHLAGILQMGQKRQLTGVHLGCFSLLALLLSCYQVWSVIWGRLDPMNQMAIHLAGILAIAFLLYGSSNHKRPSLLDYIATSLALAASIHFTIYAEWFATRIPIMEALRPIDIFFGLVFVLLSLEAARRTIGLPIVLIAGVGIAYALWGHHLQGIFGHRPFTSVEILDDIVYSFNGLWGSPISVAASFVFMFILFGAFLNHAGAGEFFFQLSTAIAGRSKGGAAKVAVLASALFGSISGSPTANVVTTGSFTIPVSKKTGYRPSFAAAVEAAASTGGSILPPIMGSSAFLMAAVTNIPYGTIVIAAILPGILYYVSLLSMVHLEAMRLDLPRTSAEEIPKLGTVLKSGWQYFIPLVVLIVFLVLGYSASRTGFYAILSIIAVSWLRKHTRMGFRKVATAMVDGARSAIPVSTACAAAGLVIAGIMSTGLGGKLTSIVLHLTAGMLLPTLLLVMLICIILGMGMPVAAAYILTAMLAAPALMELGVSSLSAHLFIVYFSIFSAITPPVAVAAFAAAGIADANPNRVGLEALRLGIVGFIVPFLFVFEPALLLDGTSVEISIAIITAIAGILMLSASIIGWLTMKTTWWERILLLIGGLLFLIPGILSKSIGSLFLLSIYIIQHRKVLVNKRSTALWQKEKINQI